MHALPRFLPPLRLFFLSHPLPCPRLPRPCSVRGALALVLCCIPLHAQLGPNGNQAWHQNSPGIGVAPETGAYTGAAVAAGDFDCDGDDDLAIGMPGEDLTGAVDAGRILVLVSGPDGPTADGEKVWGQNSPVLIDVAEAADWFGSVLAVGDFDGDQCDDLAVGIPLEDVYGVKNTGAVQVLMGSPGGLTGDGDLFFHLETQWVVGEPRQDDWFGYALAVGDFNADGIDDLAVGSPGKDVGLHEAGGIIHFLFGASPQPLAGSTSRVWFQGYGEEQVYPDDWDRYGWSLAAGELVPEWPGDELVVGIPGRHSLDAVPQPGVGAIHVVGYGEFGPLKLHELWQHNLGLPAPATLPDEGDFLGWAVATGDFDGDGLDEIAVGIPSQEFVGVDGQGAVAVVDLQDGQHQLWTQEDLPPQISGTQDVFGSVLLAADFDGDGLDDLAIGVPMDDTAGLADAGLVHVLYGKQGVGVTAERDQILYQTFTGQAAGNRFGASLAAGRLTGGAAMDLMVGAPGTSIAGHADAGSVHVFATQTLFVDGFESGGLGAWN